MSFSTVAEFYDLVNGSAYIPYADYLEQAFSHSQIEVREVLDLGCGTGGICSLLADKGYDMVALDISYEMLNLARERNMGKNTLLLCQDMRDFELYGTVQAVYSSFDCLNYLDDNKDLKQVFVLVRNYLESGGVFAFDVNTEYRYKNVLDGKSFVYEVDNGLAVWRSAYSDVERDCEFVIDLFSQTEPDLYERTTEVQNQHLFTRDELLSAADGFELLSVSGGKGFDGCTEREKEYYIFRKK